MAAHTLTNTVKFPVGTVVSVYDAQGFGTWPGFAPGSAVDSATMTTDGATFSGLIAGRRYFLHAVVGGADHVLTFTASGSEGSGNVFVVDPSTSGSLQAAIDNCADDNGDIVQYLQGTHTVESTVDFNKSGITVIASPMGIAPTVRGEFHAILADAAFTSGPVAQVTKPCTIEGLGFVSRDAGATFFSGAALLLGGNGDANPFGAHLKGCRFPKWNVDNRIGVAVEGSTDCLIEECVFEGVGADFDAGVYIQGAMQNLIIRRNYFRQCTAAVVCGAFAGGGPHVFIHENFVEDGKLLDTDGNSGNGLISGNWLETATDTGSYDRALSGGGNLQNDGWNFSGNHYSE